MDIKKHFKVPTGDILTVEGDKGKLELISVGDYGKEKNIKADFLGYDEEINGVPHGELQPLEEKWVITVSSQYGCAMDCKFCDAPKVGNGRNATFNDLINQVKTGISLHPEIEKTNRLNVHFARMGEPTFNSNVIDATLYLAGMLKEKDWGFHPVISTMMPKNNHYLDQFIIRWARLKNRFFNGEAGLQLSINTTDNELRQKHMGNSTLSLEEISETFNLLAKPKGRKYTLNFAYCGQPIDENKLRELFNPEKFICKITPMHLTDSCKENDLITEDGYDSFYPYKDVEERLKSVGFDVIVFVPSCEEDEGRITCGNAILSGTKPECKYKKIK